MSRLRPLCHAPEGPARTSVGYVMNLFAYMNVYSAGPLMIVRVPVKGKKPGRRRIAPSASHLLRALTPVMHEHGLRQKDITSWDALSTPNEWDPDPDDFWVKPEHIEKALQTLALCEAAFAGSPDVFKKFWLYAWTGRDGGSFDLVREPSQ